MTTTDDHKALVRRYHDDLWNRWNLGLVGELIDPDLSFRGSLGVTVDGRAGFAGYVALVRAAFPDFHNTIESLVAEDDTVVSRLTYGEPIAASSSALPRPASR